METRTVNIEQISLLKEYCKYSDDTELDMCISTMDEIIISLLDNVATSDEFDKKMFINLAYIRRTFVILKSEAEKIRKEINN